MESERKPETVADSIGINALLDESPWGPYQKYILGLLAFAYLTDGIANQSLGLAIPALMKDWGLPREAFASIAAIGLVGLAIGAVVGGIAGDKFGRRKAMLASVAFFGLMTIAQAWVRGTTDLAILRFLDGIGIGAMIPNGAALISEFTPRRRRALALAIGMTFVAVGAMVAGLIGNALIEPQGWQGLFLALGGIALGTALLLALALPESPVHLANAGSSPSQLDAILRKCGLSANGRTLTASAEGDDPAGRAPIKALFAQGVASSTIFLWLAFFFCLLANYAMFSWIPAMLAQMGHSLAKTSLGMTALSLGGIVGGMSSGWFISHFGSRGAVLTLTAGGVISAVMLGLTIGGGTTGLNTVLAWLSVIGFFSASLINGLYTFSAFIYPDHARSTGIGAAAAAGRIGAIASSYAGVMALGLGGPASYFLLIAGALAAAFVGVALIKRQIPKEPD